MEMIVEGCKCQTADQQVANNNESRRPPTASRRRTMAGGLGKQTTPSLEWFTDLATQSGPKGGGLCRRAKSRDMRPTHRPEKEQSDRQKTTV